MYGGNIKVNEKKIGKNGSFILACAGLGKRMGLSYPKQFLEFNGKPLFLKSLVCAENSEYVKEIIIVTQKEHIVYISEVCEKENLKKVSVIIEGGAERQDSIYEGIKKVSSNSDYIIVQDAVRPFCKEKYFKECWEALQIGYDGAVVGVKVRDTIKEIFDVGGENRILKTLKRENLFAANTPQVFRKEVLEEAYNRAYRDNFLGTDDASLVERLGFLVKAIFGDYDNIKITVPEDLKFL